MSRTSSSANPDAYFKDPEPEPAEDFDDGGAWGDMDDMYDDGAFFTAPDSTSNTAAAKKAPAKAKSPAFEEGGEPDFAGWLAAQAGKKTTGGKPLPKGLAKPGAASGKKPIGAAAAKAAPKPKPVVAKKIDLKPKDTDDDDAWGEGW